MIEEIEKLRKKLSFYESKSQNSIYFKKNKGARFLKSKIDTLNA